MLTSFCLGSNGPKAKGRAAQLCRREGISQGIYYKWSKDFMEASKRRLAGDAARSTNHSALREGFRGNETIQ